ncbi:MAG: glycosyltransferase family 9 protein [Ignavibacteriaceae bacterium]|nr:glycosyltransferase family 9 protein [Ignavibacteriaceae bacterium]
MSERFSLIKKILAPLLFILSKFLRKIFSRKKNDKNLVILSFCNLGDTILSVPSFKKIIEFYPDYQISVLTYSHLLPVFDELKLELNVHSVHKKDFLHGRIATKNVREKVKSLNPKIIYDLSGDIHTASIIINSSAEKIYGITRPLYTGLFDKYVPLRTTPGLADIYLDGAEIGGKIERKSELYDFNIPVSKGEHITICPIAGWDAKEWGIKNYSSLALLLSKEYKVRFVIEKGTIKKDVIKGISEICPVLESENVKDLINLIKDSKLIICNDSGPSHVASITGTPVFIIFGPTNPEYCVPLTKYHKYFVKRIACSPVDTNYCHTYAGRYCQVRDCIKNITVPEIYKSVDEYIRNSFIK